METTTLLDDLCFPEAPRWHEGRLWFSDMHDECVVAVDLDGTRETICRVPGCPSGLGWLPDGRLLVVSMEDRRLLRLDGETLNVAADLSALVSARCNDAVVDAHGRCYVGNFGFDLHAEEAPCTAELVLVSPGGDARIVADDLSFPNGCVLTPDGGTLIVGETFAARLTAFAVAADGSLSDRRVWAQLSGAVPDGICLDAEGAVWVASPVSAEVLRVREGGRVEARVSVGTQAFACMLGGPEGRDLFICTAQDAHPEKCRAARSGRIEQLRVDVPRAGLP